VDASECKFLIPNPPLGRFFSLNNTNIKFKGMVTSAQKLNRKVILKKYQKDVDAAYAHK